MLNNAFSKMRTKNWSLNLVAVNHKKISTGEWIRENGRRPLTVKIVNYFGKF